MAKKIKIDLNATEKEKKIELVNLIDRENIFPCRKCRKNDTCLLRPYDGKCVSFEEGITWTKQYKAMQRLDV